MAIELMASCDECQNILSDGDEVYCVNCFRSLEKDISSLEEKISQLEDVITGLEADLNIARGENT